MPLMSVDEAIALLRSEVTPFEIERLPLENCLGLTLGEDIVSGVDSPPFDKALMDGYAVRASDLSSGEATLRVIEEVTAGRVPSRMVAGGEATRIMTGAPIPPGADAVVRVEDTSFDEATGNVRIRASVRAGMDILRRATSVAIGQRVLTAGRALRAQELGALAELGIAAVPVRRRPRVAVLATGDELVPVGETPGPGQIRNSNETMLAGQIEAAGGMAVPLGIARDERSHLAERIRAGLSHDVLLLTGGVSAGKLDLVPSELAAAGVRQVFHKVDLKPGKPIWFGKKTPPETSLSPSASLAPLAVSQSSCLVFGLPGNPVSSLVCFELFVRPAIRRLMGAVPDVPPPVLARLEKVHVARSDRPTYHPAHLTWTDAGATVRTVRWHGSSDLCGTLEANAMALFPAGEHTYDAGSFVPVFAW